MPEVEENPDNYLEETKGHLHRVRYEKQFFMDLFTKAEVIIEVFAHQQITRTQQSVIIVHNRFKLNENRTSGRYEWWCIRNLLQL